MTYDEQYAQALKNSSKRIADSIDAEILFAILISAGWTSVYVKGRNTSEIETWVKKYCVGKYRVTTDFYLFEKEKDATLFILKWA